jgi:hypothetical protein
MELLAQVSEPALRDMCVQYLIDAALRQKAEFDKEWGFPLERVRFQDSVWRVGARRYAWFPSIDDEVFATCADMTKDTSISLTVFVPSGYDCLLGHALNNILGGRCPGIVTLELYISLRVKAGARDRRLAGEWTLLDLFRRYNRRLMDHGGDRAILIDIPSDCGPPPMNSS